MIKAEILNGLLSVIALTFSALVAVDSEQTFGYSYPNLKQSTNEFVTGLGGYVELVFPKNSTKFNDFQLLKAISSPENYQLIKPNSSRLSYYGWRRLLSHTKDYAAVCLPAKDSTNLNELYEVWGDISLPNSDRGNNPEFLGYIKVKKQVESFFDFYEQNKYSFWSKNPNEFAEKLTEEIKNNCYWTKNLLIKLDTEMEPQTYKIVQLLGAGQDGYVLKATPVNNEKNPTIAIKLWNFGNPKMYFPAKDYQIEREISARTVLAGHKENVTQLLSSKPQVISGMTGIVMEYVDGETLESFIDRKPEITYEDAARLIKQISGVTSAILLEDLTRPNIMVDKSGNIKFIDFSKWTRGSSISDYKIGKKLEGIERDIRNLVKWYT